MAFFYKVVILGPMSFPKKSNYNNLYLDFFILVKVYLSTQAVFTKGWYKGEQSS